MDSTGKLVMESILLPREASHRIYVVTLQRLCRRDRRVIHLLLGPELRHHHLRAWGVWGRAERRRRRRKLRRVSRIAFHRSDTDRGEWQQFCGEGGRNYGEWRLI